MTSKGSASFPRLLANRRNALASTGPVTRPGKLRVRRNALKHGLSAGPLAKKHPKRKIEALVLSLVGSAPSEEAYKAAVDFAVAHLQWQRVVLVRNRLLRSKLKEQVAQGGAKACKLAREILFACDPQVVRLGRYERRAFNRRLGAARALDGNKPIPMSVFLSW